MANNAGKTIGALLGGVVIGAAVGYLIGTDEDKRKEHLEKLKEVSQQNYDKLSTNVRKGYANVKDKVQDKVGQKAAGIEEEIYNDDDD